jgi:hypothetical protein
MTALTGDVPSPIITPEVLLVAVGLVTDVVANVAVVGSAIIAQVCVVLKSR